MTQHVSAPYTFASFEDEREHCDVCGNVLHDHWRRRACLPRADDFTAIHDRARDAIRAASWSLGNALDGQGPGELVALASKLQSTMAVFGNAELALRESIYQCLRCARWNHDCECET